MERILGTPCNKLGVNVFSFSAPLTSVLGSLFRGFLSFFSIYFWCRRKCGPTTRFKMNISRWELGYKSDSPEPRQTYPDSVTPSSGWKLQICRHFHILGDSKLGIREKFLSFFVGCEREELEILFCLHQRPICGLQAREEEEGGLCYYNFTKLLQLLEAVLRLFVRSQDELRAERGQHLERGERARDATTFYLNTSL